MPANPELGIRNMNLLPVADENVPFACDIPGADQRPTLVELYHGDCVEGMKAIPDKTVDLVVPSPPYNLGISYRSFNDDQERDQHLTWCEKWGREVRRVMKDDGALFLNVGGSPSNPLLPHQLAVRFSEFFVLQNTFHWIKSITVQPREGPEISAGHFKPINSRRFVNDCHEFIFHLTKDGKVPLDRLAVGVEYADKSNIARWAHTRGERRDRRCRGNNWFIAYETIQRRARERPHPATFPVQLAERCIKLHGVRPDLTVLDPFVGTGSSAVAAQACSVARFIGFDIDADYLRIAAERTETTVRAVARLALPEANQKNHN
jgi:site-specific DNA-methyltransferase (adenine-specific)